MDLLRNYKKEIDAIPLDSDENWDKYFRLCDERITVKIQRRLLISLVLSASAAIISITRLLLLLIQL